MHSATTRYLPIQPACNATQQNKTGKKGLDSKQCQVSSCQVLPPTFEHLKHLSWGALPPPRPPRISSHETNIVRVTPRLVQAAIQLRFQIWCHIQTTRPSSRKPLTTPCRGQRTTDKTQRARRRCASGLSWFSLRNWALTPRVPQSDATLASDREQRTDSVCTSTLRL